MKSYTKSFFGVVSIFIFIFISVDYSEASNCRGCVIIDEYTFTKIIEKFEATLVKFDISYPYGDQHDMFEKAALDGHTIPNLLFGTVGVKDYGDMDNLEFAKKYGYSDKESLPFVYLFIHNATENTTKEIQFKNPDFTTDNLKKFVSDNSGIYFPLSGCDEVLDRLASKFMDAKEENEARKILSEAENESTRKNKQIYIQIMEKVVKLGSKFISNEINRVNNVRSGKITKEKKKELDVKLNILRSFKKRDEL